MAEVEKRGYAVMATQDVNLSKLVEGFIKQATEQSNRIEKQVGELSERISRVESDRVRTTREQDTRQAAEASRQPKILDWGPRLSLDTTSFPPRPGYAQRWVRYKRDSDFDGGNLDRYFNEGWRPRSKETLPDKKFYTQSVGRELDGYEYDGTPIQIRGMILMERPMSVHEDEVTRERQASTFQKAAVRMEINSANRRNSAHRGFTSIEMDHETTLVRGNEPPRRIRIDD